MAAPSSHPQTLQSYHHDPPTRPTLLSLPPEIRLQILNYVLRLAQPIKPTCPYRYLHANTSSIHPEQVHLERVHFTLEIANAGPRQVSPKRQKKPKLAGPKPPFWAVLLSNKQIYAEAGAMVGELNAVHFEDPTEIHRFRHAHPLPRPDRFVLKGPSRPRTDRMGIRTVVLDTSRLSLQPWLDKGLEARIVVRALRPFKRLRTVYLRLTIGGPREVQMLDRMWRQFAGLPKFDGLLEVEADNFVVRDRDAQGSRRARPGCLRIGVIGAEDAAWLCGMPVAAVRACARVSMKRYAFNL